MDFYCILSIEKSRLHYYSITDLCVGDMAVCVLTFLS